MKKLILILLISLFPLASAAMAGDIIYLKSGKVVKGKILQENNDSVVIEVKKFPYKYYRDQIDHIDKDPGQFSAIPIAIETKNIQEIPEEKVKLIVRYMEMNGTVTKMKLAVEHTIASAPDERKKELTEIFSLNEILEALVPIYNAHFSEEELLELIDFYGSPLRRKELEVTDLVMKESLLAIVEIIQRKERSLGL